MVRFRGIKTPVLRAFYDPKLSRNLIEFVRDERIEVIHANILNPRYVNPLIEVKRRVADVKLVVTAHSWTFLCPTSWKIKFPEMRECRAKSSIITCTGCMYAMSRRLGKPFIKLVKGLHQTNYLVKLLKNSDLVISPSKTFAERAREELGIKNIVHIPNPANPAFLEKKPTPPREQASIFIGRLEFEKGAHLLPQIAREMNPIKLYVVGQGSLAKYINETRPSNLVFLGYVSPAEKDEMLERASTLIVPSIWQDMYPTTIIEAFAKARPVIAFSLGGPKELIEASGGGVLIKPYNVELMAKRAVELNTDALKCFRLGMNARAYVENELNINTYSQRLKDALLEYLWK